MEQIKQENLSKTRRKFISGWHNISFTCGVGSDDALEGDHSSRSGDRKLSVHVIHFNGVKHLLMTTIETALAAQVQGLQVLRIGWFTLALSGRNTHFRRDTELDKRHR